MKGVATQQDCLDRWEQIVKENEKATNSYQFFNFLELSQSHLQLVREHQLVKLCLIRLYIKFDDGIANDLRQMGYGIADPKDPAKYFRSLNDCMNNSNNLITQILMKRKEMEKLSEESKEQRITFEDRLAEVGYHLGFPLKEDITLAQFNSYRKLLNKKKSEKSREKSFD